MKSAKKKKAVHPLSSVVIRFGAGAVVRILIAVAEHIQLIQRFVQGVPDQSTGRLIDLQLERVTDPALIRQLEELKGSIVAYLAEKAEGR